MRYLGLYASEEYSYLYLGHTATPLYPAPPVPQCPRADSTADTATQRPCAEYARANTRGQTARGSALAATLALNHNLLEELALPMRNPAKGTIVNVKLRVVRSQAKSRLRVGSSPVRALWVPRCHGQSTAGEAGRAIAKANSLGKNGFAP